MAEIGRIVATAVLDVDPFETSTRVLKTHLRSIDNALSAQEKAIKSSGNSINGLKNSYSLTGKSISSYNTLLTQQTEKYEKLKAETGDLSKATVAQKTDLLSAEAAMNQTAGRIEELTGKYNALGKQIAIQESSWTKLGTGLTTVGKKMQTVGTGFTDFGKQMSLGVTAPIVSGATAVTAAAISWESAFAGVKKTSDEVVDANGKVVYSYADLESGLRNLSKELPSTHTEIAGVAEAAGQLGIATPDIVSFTKTMLDMGESTNLSAEEAATAIAKMANITGLTSDEYQRFGSSVVALGNNFATTESDIVMMSTRLASAGTLAGLTNQEILGLATAMSSVGIEAEAGGTAMTQTLTAMESAAAQGGTAFDELRSKAESAGYSLDDVGRAVSNGGDELKSLASAIGIPTKELSSMYKEADKASGKLEDFARISNMSSAEFVQAWNERPAEAIQAFIKGLGELDEKGESATLVLDEMGLSGVRQSNMLKSLALASDTMTSAIDMSNQAWDENTALTNEASTRYETTESKLKMLRNEAVDAAIDLGGPFVDALRSGLEASKPLIETLGDLARKFSEMNPEQQQNIVKWIGIAAAIGPASSALGSFLKITGGGISTIGSFATKIGEFSGKMTASSGEMKIAETGIAALGTSSGTMATILGTATTSVGGFTGALGFLTSPLGIAIGAIGVGAAAWKLWGEEVWNSSQRTQRWGTDVGEHLDGVFTKVQGFSTESIGQFSLMEQGVITSTDGMISSFQKMGETMETDLKQRVEGLKGLLEELPKGFEAEAEKLVSAEIQRTEKALQNLTDTNAKISEIRERAANDSREVTIAEGKQINDLMRQSAEEYLNITIDNKDQRKQILDAMTGDITTASEEQAQVWLQSLGKQRQAIQVDYQDKLQAQKDFLKERGMLESDFGKEWLALFEKSSKQATEVIDQQATAITDKYPELLDKVMIANGQLASSMGEAGDYVAEANKKLLSSVKDMSSQIEESAEKNAQTLGMLGDEATKSGEKWNSIVLDEKTGEVKTNAVEEVKNATVSVSDWNDLAYGAKEAKLESNAKLVIAEAALSNGHWGALEFMGKEALIESNATRTIIEAAQANGSWNEMSFEQKKALLYSDTPEKVAQAVSDMGLWDQLAPTVKELKAENYDFYNKINESDALLTQWNEIDPGIKELIVDNGLTNEALSSSSQLLDAYNQLPAEIKQLLADTYGLDAALVKSEQDLASYNSREVLTKMLTGDSTNVMTAAQIGEQVLNQYGANNPALKLLLGDSASTQNAAAVGEAFLNAYNSNNPLLKLLLGDSSNVQNAAQTGGQSLNIYSANNPVGKNLLGNSSNVINAAQTGGQALTTFNNNNPAEKSLSAVDNASGPANTAVGSVQSFMSLPNIVTKTVQIVQSVIGSLTGHEKGTNYHLGGPALVNDQRGSTYKELVTLPSGYSFIPEERNVPLNLPRGSKVLPANKTERLFSKYSDGIGDFSTTRVAQVMDKMPSDLTQFMTPVLSIDESSLSMIVDNVVSRMNQSPPQNENSKLIQAIVDLASRPVSLAIDGHEIAVATIDEMNALNVQSVNNSRYSRRLPS